MEIILGILGIIVAIVSGWYTYRSYQQGNAVTSKSAELEFDIYSKAPKNIYILLPFEKNKKIIFPLVFSLKNSGLVSARNVEIFITVSNSLLPSDIEKSVSKIGEARGVKYASEKGRTKHLTDSYIKVGDIPPNTTIDLLDEFGWGEETILDFPVEATSKDGVNLVCQVIMTYAVILNIKITQQDNQPIDRKYSISFRKLYQNEDISCFAKREQKLMESLDKNKSQNEPVNNTYDAIRVVTFKEYEKLNSINLSESDRKKYKNKKGKMTFVRGERRSINYFDCIIKGTEILLKEKNDNEP